MRSVRTILVMVASWMSLVAARPADVVSSQRELLAATAVDVAVAAPVARYAVVNDGIATARLSRVAPIALFLCAFATLLLSEQRGERARTEARVLPRALDPRVVPYDAMAPPVLRLSSSAA